MLIGVSHNHSRCLLNRSTGNPRIHEHGTRDKRTPTCSSTPAILPFPQGPHEWTYHTQIHTATSITLNPIHYHRANTQNLTFEGNLRISAPMATHRSVAISGALSEMPTSQAAVITDSVVGVQGALQKSQIKSKHVHWEPLPVHPPARRGVLRLIAYRPLYNRNHTARPFNVHIRFGQEIRTVKFESLRLMANMLLDFECRLVVAFPPPGGRKASADGICPCLHNRRSSKQDECSGPRPPCSMSRCRVYGMHEFSHARIYYDA
jgi:hypothetical protein